MPQDTTWPHLRPRRRLVKVIIVEANQPSQTISWYYYSHGMSKDR